MGWKEGGKVLALSYLCFHFSKFFDGFFTFLSQLLIIILKTFDFLKKTTQFYYKVKNDEKTNA